MDQPLWQRTWSVMRSLVTSYHIPGILSDMENSALAPGGRAAIEASQPSFESMAIRIRSIALRAPSFCLSWVQLFATVL